MGRDCKLTGGIVPRRKVADFHGFHNRSSKSAVTRSAKGISIHVAVGAQDAQAEKDTKDDLLTHGLLKLPDYGARQNRKNQVAETVHSCQHD